MLSILIIKIILILLILFKEGCPLLLTNCHIIVELRNKSSLVSLVKTVSKTGFEKINEIKNPNMFQNQPF